MKIINYHKLNSEEKTLIDRAKKVAKKSITHKKHYVGAVIFGYKGGIYEGATMSRTRAIGSTCAERMALDQLLFKNREAPKTVYLIGVFERPGWKENFVCTPCGVCLEMFLESKQFFGIDNINFVCSSWDKTKIIKGTLNELFPQYEKKGWKRTKTTAL